VETANQLQDARLFGELDLERRLQMLNLAQFTYRRDLGHIEALRDWSERPAQGFNHQLMFMSLLRIRAQGLGQDVVFLGGVTPSPGSRQCHRACMTSA